MSYSLTIGRLFGTAIRLHVTFLLFLLTIGGVTWAQGGSGAAVATVGFVSLLFACVVLHEFGHILAARRYGVHTPDVILLPIGGVARMARMPQTPGQEIAVALAGPAVNVVIAAGLLLVLGGLPSLAEIMAPTVAGLAGRLLYANVFLVLFNLIPAFPMDGGRVLRALLSLWRGPVSGTRIAARLGQGFAVVFGLLGLVSGNIVLILVGVFIYFAAAAEGAAASRHASVTGLRNSDAMISRFARLGLDSSLGDAVACRLQTGQAVIPICDGEGRLAGVASRSTIYALLAERGASTPIVEVMTAGLPIVPVRGELAETTRLLQDANWPAVGVVDGDERLVGLVTHETIDDLAALADATRRGGRTTFDVALGRGAA
jgi:Zn-dependent protease/CBS domain-containing protein